MTRNNELKKNQQPQEIHLEPIISEEHYSLDIYEFQAAQRAMAIALFNLETQEDSAQKGQK